MSEGSRALLPKWENLTDRAGRVGVNPRYSYRSTAGLTAEDLAYVLELRGWQRQDSDDGSVVLRMSDFVPDAGLAVDPVEQALIIIRDERVVMTNYAKPLSVGAAFALAVGAALLALRGPDSAVFFLVCVFIIVAWVQLLAFAFGSYFGLRTEPSTTPAEIRLAEESDRLRVEVSLSSQHYAHDASVEERLCADLLQLESEARSLG